MSCNPHFSHHANAGGSAQQSSNGAAAILVFPQEATHVVYHQSTKEAREGGCKVWHELFFGLPHTRKRSGASFG